jgi:hypothetical protein
MSQAKKFLQDMPDFSRMVAAAKQSAEAGALEAAEAKKRRDELAACVEAAYLVASADGNLSDEEMKTIGERMDALSDGAVGLMDAAMFVAGASAKIKEIGRDGLIADIARRLDSETKRQAGFMVAAHTSWKGGGIGMQEGLALQALSKAFGWEMNYMHKQLALARS